MNKYIKEVGKLAELNELVTVSKTRAGQKEVRTLPKYSLITVHTARRSFATNLYLAGMDTLTIKKMTGHHTEKSFLKYIRVSEEENASRAALHAFFNWFKFFLYAPKAWWTPWTRSPIKILSG